MAERQGRDALAEVLDRRAQAGNPVFLWWRDDDAVAATPALARLIDLGAAHGIAPVVAAIPGAARDDLAAAVGAGAVRVAVHGIAHENHAPAGEKKCELAAGLPVDQVVTELSQARLRLAGIVGAALIDMLVPPWNRIAPAIAARLDEAGFTALSAFGPGARTPAPGVAAVNAHVDIIDWGGTRGGRASPSLFEEIARAVDSGAAGGEDQPLGILTHHLVHDAAAWRFLEQLFELTSRHPGVEWCRPGSLPGVGASRAGGAGAAAPA